MIGRSQASPAGTPFVVTVTERVTGPAREPHGLHEETHPLDRP